MDDRIIEAETPPSNPPTTREECRQRLAQLQNDITAIRTEIAAADMDRQAGHRRMDARWYHRARTALRHRQREVAEVAALMARLPGRKDALKDLLIEVVRADYDETGWHRVMDEAHRRLDARGAAI
jgi:hypothetical protein